MIQNYVPEQYEKTFGYCREFDDGNGNQFGIPCDENGNLLDTSQTALDNYNQYLKNPDGFIKFNELTKYPYLVKVKAHGTCHCGNEVYLYDEFESSTTQCEKCGQWYNSFGEKILSPEEQQEKLRSELSDCECSIICP